MATSVQLWPTYYYFPLVDDYSGADDTPLYTPQGALIAMVPQAFAASFCIEGSGRLRDGRVVNYAAACGAGVPGLDCNAINHASIQLGSNGCYAVLDPARYPWGIGVGGRALVPLRSIATDRNTIPWGSTVYLAQFDGLAIPQVGDLGGFTHNGCFEADDTGGAITGNHIDIFAGSSGMYHALEALVPTHSTLDGAFGADACALPPPGSGAASSGSLSVPVAAGIALALGGVVAAGVAAVRARRARAAYAGYSRNYGTDSRNAAPRRKPLRK